MKLVTIALLLPLAACGLTKKEAEDVTKVSAAILCGIEQAELDDDAFNKLCDTIVPQLTPAQQKAVQAHREKARAAKAAKPCTP